MAPLPAVRRWFGPGPAWSPGLACALTPPAALIFRFNNPDALLTLLMTASAYAVQRAVEHRRSALRWLLLAGLLLGFGFLAKMLQAFLVLPGFRARLPGGRADLQLLAGSGTPSRPDSR